MSHSDQENPDASARSQESSSTLSLPANSKARIRGLREPTVSEALKATATSSKRAHKRTKTGCFTCRKRRIKCGEERPACHNCVKADRECSGYDQRIVFRDPLQAPDGPSIPSTSLIVNFAPIAFSSDDLKRKHRISKPSKRQEGGRPVHQYAPFSDDSPRKQDFSGSSRDVTLTENYGNNNVSHVSEPSLTRSDSTGSRTSSMQPRDSPQVPNDATSALIALHDFEVHLIEESCRNPEDFYDKEHQGTPTYSREVWSSYENDFGVHPVLDLHKAQILRHFILSTSTILSLDERNNFDPEGLFSGQLVPETRQGLWTYIMPHLGLKVPALMFAILAISTLHMARLDDHPPVESLKYYGLAIRRLRKSVSHPLSTTYQRRENNTAALGASLLLGYYEVMAAEHTKWTRHLSGARQFLDEIEPPNIDDQEYLVRQSSSKDILLDMDLIKLFTGLTAYEKMSESKETMRSLESEGTARYHTHSDLFWWFRKQDLFHSIIGGVKLTLHSSYWLKYLPRAPMGLEEMPCGTYDHLVIIMGRLADFAARDQVRKGLLLEVTGVPWQPPSWMALKGGPPLTTPSLEVLSTPAMHGVDDLDSKTLVAYSEWAALHLALSTFLDRLGPHFQAIEQPPEAAIQTPFGAALEFPTLDIASIWNLYQTALIILYRVHPAMPQSPHQAAGVCAPLTAQLANTIGRITAGICLWSTRREDGSTSSQINPALFESTTPLYFAGVQYSDSEQRQWLIHELLRIGQITGMGSANAVAAGCETAWRVAASLGRGPPYERVLYEPLYKDGRGRPVRESSGIQQHERRGENVFNNPNIEKSSSDDESMLGGRALEDCKIVVWEPDGARAHWSLGLLDVEIHAEGGRIRVRRDK